MLWSWMGLIGSLADLQQSMQWAQNGDQSMNLGNRFISNTLIITAQFLSPGDVCWDKDGMYIYVYAR